MPTLGESKRFQDFENRLDGILNKAKGADVEIRKLDDSITSLGSGIKETLVALEDLGLIKDSMKVTRKQIEAAEKAFTDFNAEVEDATTSVYDYIKGNKALQQELKEDLGIVKKTTDETKKLSDAQKRRQKNTREEIALNKEMQAGLEKTFDTIKKLKKEMGEGGIKVRINNAGFKSVLDELSTAIKNFKRRKGNGDKNFFDAFVGTREDNLKSSERVISDAKDLAVRLKTSLSDGLTESLEKKIANAITTGIKTGIQKGVSATASIDPTAQLVGAILKESKASQPTKARVLQTMLGKTDETAIQLQKIKSSAEKSMHKQSMKTKENVAVAEKLAELQFAEENPTSNAGRKAAAQAQKAITEAKKEQYKYEKLLKKEEEERTNRERNAKEKVRIEKELSQVYGEEGSKLQALGKQLVLLNADLRQYQTQGEKLNKINYAQVARKTEQIRKVTRQWAEELYKTTNGYNTIDKTLKNVVNRMKEVSAIFQTTSATISSAAGIWSTLRSKSTGFFRHMTNGFRRVFSYARRMADSLFDAGVEQREKIERAQIGFKAFFGEERVPQVTEAVRREAAKTPIVNAGDLANYVMQLAPVAQGNASLALNSSLGILKALVYSGSDISEGEYVIKNIRDVIAKGKATAIDIRQFNRALPGLEKAIKQMPDLADFINEEGKLNITKDNVGRVLDVFATLNKDENSPLKQIEKDQLETLQGMKQLFEEKKTTAMETILRDSGVFDMLYNLLGIATNDDTWKKVTDFVTKYLKPIVTNLNDFLMNTDWGAVGKKLSEYWGIVKAGIVDAKNIIVETGSTILGGSNAQDIFKKLAEIIASFIRGFGQGVSEAMKFAKWLSDRLSNGDLPGLAEKIGKFLVSPLGKIIQTLMGIGANAFGAASRGLSTMSKIIEASRKFSNWIGGMEATAFADSMMRMSSGNPLVGYGNLLSAMNKVSPMMASTLLSQTDLAELQMNTGLYNATHKTNVTVKKGGMFGWMSNIKNGAAATGNALKMLGARIMKGLAAGGIIYTIGTAATSIISSLNLFGEKTKTVTDIVSVAFNGLAGAIGIASMTGGSIAGGLIGAIGGAALALNRLAVEADKARVAEEKKRLEQMLAGGRKELADSIVKAVQEAGIEQFDIESDEGRYAYNELIEYLNEFDDLGMVDIAKAENQLLKALRDKTVATQVHEYANSDEYNNLGGRVLDLDVDKEYRDRMAEFIKKNLLLGTDFDYGTSNESIVKSWLNGDSLTDRQVDALTSKYDSLYTVISDKTTGLLGKIDNSSTTIQDAITAIDANTLEMDRLRQSQEKGGLLSQLVKNAMSYDEIVEKGTYTSGGKTWGYVDIVDYINQNLHSAIKANDKSGVQEWTDLGAFILNGLHNGDLSTAQAFRYMMHKYGDRGFEDFFNSHGIAETRDDQGNITSTSRDNYLKAIKGTGYFDRQVGTFQLLTSLYGYEFESKKIASEEMKNKIKDATMGMSSIMSESDKESLIQKYQEMGDDAFSSYKKEHQEAAAEANKRLREQAHGGKEEKHHWWDFLHWFPYYENHGGHIKPIYRAGGGELGVDTVPAMLQPGEFVMRKSSVNKAGLSTMMALNRGDMSYAARSLGARFSGNYNNSRNWSSTINNNQRTQTNYIKVTNRNTSSRLNSYYGLANRIALA